MYKLTKNDWVIRPLFLLSVLILGVFLSFPEDKSPTVQVQAQAQAQEVPAVVPVSPAPPPPPPAETKIPGPYLNIEAIGINIPLGQTSLDKQGHLAVPANPNAAAWYKLGPKIGELGTALITGHYDANGGRPGVFYNLKKLQTGDEIKVGRSDGSVAIFIVDKLVSYSQDDTFPWNLVYSTTGLSGLRIITCDGTYNPRTGKYSRNLVVYASF